MKFIIVIEDVPPDAGQPGNLSANFTQMARTDEQADAITPATQLTAYLNMAVEHFFAANAKQTTPDQAHLFH